MHQGKSSQKQKKKNELVLKAECWWNYDISGILNCLSDKRNIL